MRSGSCRRTLHFHALVLDGVYASSSPFERPAFHPAEPLTDREMVEVLSLFHRRVLRYLTRCGRLRREAEEVEPDEPLLAELYAAAVEGRGVLAARGEPGVQRLGRRRDAGPLFLSELCASLEGFSLHAKVSLEADDHAGRERLARYLARPRSETPCPGTRQMLWQSRLVMGTEPRRRYCLKPFMAGVLLFFEGRELQGDKTPKTFFRTSGFISCRKG